METLTNEIKNCLLKQLWYAALVLTLTLPDVCAALESPDGRSTPDRYKAWYDTWLKRKYENVSADDLYFLRCGVAHQAKLEHPAMQYQRIFFTLRSKTGFFAHNNVFNDCLNLDLVLFCKDVVDSVEEWRAQTRDNENVGKNLRRFVRYYPNGFENFIRGLPVIG